MVKTVLTLLLLVAPLATAEDTLTCAIAGAPAMDSTIAAAAYMMAATARCTKGAKTYDDIKCEIDIASAMKSVNDIINIITAAVNQCDGALNQKHAACGAAVGSLTSAAAGLAAGVGGMVHWAEDKSGGGDVVVESTKLKLGMCVTDVGGVAHGLFSVAAGIKSATVGCKGDDEQGCATDVLNVVSILSNIGSAAAKITAHCLKGSNANGDMSGDILALSSAAEAVATAGLAVARDCKVPDSDLVEVEIKQSRLVALGMDQMKEPSNNSLSLALAAFLPISVVLGFVLGRRLNKRGERVAHLDEELSASEFE